MAWPSGHRMLANRRPGSWDHIKHGAHLGYTCQQSSAHARQTRKTSYLIKIKWAITGFSTQPVTVKDENENGIDTRSGQSPQTRSLAHVESGPRIRPSAQAQKLATRGQVCSPGPALWGHRALGSSSLCHPRWLKSLFRNGDDRSSSAPTKQTYQTARTSQMHKPPSGVHEPLWASVFSALKWGEE